MYITTIASVNGCTVTDTKGKQLIMTGKAPLFPGQKVPTDGKVVYHNMPNSSGGVIFPQSDYLYGCGDSLEDIDEYVTVNNSGTKVKELKKQINPFLIGSKFSKEVFAKYDDDKEYWVNNKGKKVLTETKPCAACFDDEGGLWALICTDGDETFSFSPSDYAIKYNDKVVGTLEDRTDVTNYALTGTGGMWIDEEGTVTISSSYTDVGSYDDDAEEKFLYAGYWSYNYDLIIRRVYGEYTYVYGPSVTKIDERTYQSFAVSQSFIVYNCLDTWNCNGTFKKSTPTDSKTTTTVKHEFRKISQDKVEWPTVSISVKEPGPLHHHKYMMFHVSLSTDAAVAEWNNHENDAVVVSVRADTSNLYKAGGLPEGRWKLTGKSATGPDGVTGLEAVFLPEDREIGYDYENEVLDLPWDAEESDTSTVTDYDDGVYAYDDVAYKSHNGHATPIKLKNIDISDLSAENDIIVSWQELKDKSYLAVKKYYGGAGEGIWHISKAKNTDLTPLGFPSPRWGFNTSVLPLKNKVKP